MADQIDIERFIHEGHESYVVKPENIDTYWDNDYDLADQAGWEDRYKHEANVLFSVFDEHRDIKSIIEIGSGPGKLGDLISNVREDIIYDRVDGSSAKRAYERRKYKGRHFYVQDLFDSFDCSEIDKKYDLVVMNDFLEHIRNPSLIIQRCRENLLHSEGFAFVSVPNWRMKHHFFYPGLFDFDNFLKFMIFEGFHLISQYPSWSKEVHIRTPRLTNIETILKPESQFDWNWYLLFKKATR